MNLAQLKKKVGELGEVRAYWSARVCWDDEGDDDTYYFGQRGHLVDDPIFSSVVFVAECGPMKGAGIVINWVSEVHAPAIGLYSW